MRLRLLCRTLLVAGLLATFLHASAQTPTTSPLEQLLKDKDYAAFTARAKKEAAAGNADAQFLLGKSYHLGLGTTVNLGEAKKWYESAARAGSAKAEHNLGSMDLEADRRDKAIGHFKKALAMGLKMPSLYNLGRVYARVVPKAPLDLAGALVAAQESADYFKQAYAIDPDAETAAQAGRQYVAMLDYLRLQKQYGMTNNYDAPALRKEAQQWLSTAMDKGSASAATNFGSLLLMEGKKADARAAFVKGAAGGNAVAHYKLAQFDEAAHANEDGVLQHFEEAYRLGYKDAADDVRRLHHEAMEGKDSDPAYLKRSADRLAQLDAKEFSEEIGARKTRMPGSCFATPSRPKRPNYQPCQCD